jgi:hypothetical protein
LPQEVSVSLKCEMFAVRDNQCPGSSSMDSRLEHGTFTVPSGDPESCCAQHIR